MRPTQGPDQDDLIRIYRATIRPLYGWVSRRTGGNRVLTEDIVQDAWMRALRAWPKSGSPDEPLAWLIHVARNVLVSHFRRIKPGEVDAASMPLEAPAWRPDAPGEAALVTAGLARIASRHAKLLEAFYFDGKSVREIAAERATSERAIEGRLRRARQKLKTQIEHLTRPLAFPGRQSPGGI